MTLNHLGISVTDPVAAREFLEAYFGMKGIGKANRNLCHVQDDRGLILSLFKGPPITEPQTTHIGFIQETEEQVNTLFERLNADGFAETPPARSHGWTFTFVAPGGFAIEVVSD